MTAPPSHTILILGAGLAGLATAYYLRNSGYEITVLDYPEWPDGFQSHALENTPVLLGCHQETHRVLHTLDKYRPLQGDRAIPLEFRLPDGRIIPYQSAHLPGAFQWMKSLFSFHGLSWQDRWRLFSHVEQIWEQAQALPEDLENRTADEWLASTGQSPAARQRIWGPLAQWLTGNELARLSGATFVRLLSTVFLRDASDASLTCCSGTIEQRLLSPLKQVLQQGAVQILPLGQPPDLRFGQDRVSEVSLHNGSRLQPRWVISALSYQHILRLLPERLLTRYAYFAHLSELQSLSGIAVQLTYQQTNQPPRLLLLPDRPFHQLTMTLPESGQIGYRFSSVGGSLAELDTDRLLEMGQTELRELFPDSNLGDLTGQTVFRESHAALLLTPGAARLRPLQHSPIQNLLVAGAWTDTGWPANVESALVSARRCADIVTGHTP